MTGRCSPAGGDPDHARRELAAWAADCAEHALAQFPDFADAAANAAITATRAWAIELVSSPDDTRLEACRDAALAAQLSARELDEAGYHAVAAGVRAASNAAASVDDPELVIVAADYAIEALAGNSAACELVTLTASERRWQWVRLPERHRAAVFDSEPPDPGPPTCAL